MPEWLRGQTRNLMGFARVGSNPAANEVQVGWPSGLRRQFQALVSSEAWVRIPLQSFWSFLALKNLIAGKKWIDRLVGMMTWLDGRAVQGASLRH